MPGRGSTFWLNFLTILQLGRIEKGDHENATNQAYTNPYATYISIVRRSRECDFL